MLFAHKGASKVLQVTTWPLILSKSDISLQFKLHLNSDLQCSYPHSAYHCGLVSFGLQDFGKMSFTVSSSWV